ncbi:conserved hypothetical protein, membrane [Candidatus Magnetomorum sp. HK-1]|nr:conserved hypothetical protein, membrane [Candidatus Magnetomorum sp. HK-1]
MIQNKKINIINLNIRFNLFARICLVAMCILILLPQTSFSDEAQLTDIIVTNTRDDLLLYMGIEGCFSHEVIKAIMSGVPATFTTFIGLYKVRRFWVDREVSAIQVAHTIKYDPMKKEFSVSRSWDKNSPIITSSFPEAQKIMSRIDNLTITPLKTLTKGSQYQIRAKAELNEVVLPFYLHYVLFFVSMWDLETDWYTVDFVY